MLLSPNVSTSVENQIMSKRLFKHNLKAQEEFRQEMKHCIEG